MTGLRIGCAAGLLSALTLAATLMPTPALAQGAGDWPNRPVKVVVPFGAGGAADRLGRIAADHLSKAFKQQFYIENRVGAGGAVASKDVARADADGYTLLVGGSGPHIMGPAENPGIGYDAVGDFTHNTEGTDTAALTQSLDTLSDTIDRMAPQALPSYLSGMLIGHEMSQLAEVARRADSPLVVVGAAALAQRYRLAAKEFGHECIEPQGNAAAVGLWRLASLLKL